MTIDHPLPEQTPLLRQLWQEAFGDTDAFLDTFWETAFAARRCLCIALEDTVAAALYWFDCGYRGEKVAYIYAVATARAYRGKGLCRALMEQLHNHLAQAGYACSILVPQERGLYQMYRAMGYRDATCITELRCTAQEGPITLRQISGAEYARLRRVFLPEGSVLQEGAGLRFLETQAAFYTGSGWLLAARKDGSVLFGMELLGDTAAAPKLLGALNCKEGYFRTPGNATPFAMYCPLTPDAPPKPEYFGLAFD